MEDVTEVKETSMEDINMQYGTMCAQLGDKEYKIKMLKEEIVELVGKLREVNLKGFELVKKQQGEANETKQ